MEPLRQHVAIAIDGGGIKGVIPVRALGILEEHLGVSCYDLAGLTAGTSTGSIISAGIASGLTAARLLQLYRDLGASIFRQSWRTALWPLTRYRYPLKPLEEGLIDALGERLMGDYWQMTPPRDLIITAFDLVTNRTRFIKPWKPEYAGWSVITAVLASCSVPTYFPPINGHLVDGGVGSYANPCYLAAFELLFCLGWDPAETTLISLGTGRAPHALTPKAASRFWAWDWIGPVLGAFLQSADDQQVHAVDTFYPTLDFRRFQVDLEKPIELDEPRAIEALLGYGEQLGQKILTDETDPAMDMHLRRAPRSR